jgi:putative transposase
MNRKIRFAPGEYYHLYNRGTEKRTVFLDQTDYRRFLNLLFLCNGELGINMRELLKQAREFEELFEVDREKPLVAIGAYCLMPNHFHILVKELEEGGTSKFMQKLTTAYTMYFNTRRHRVGSLFQGTFKAEQVGKDQYLKYLYSYVHLNPVKLFDRGWKSRKLRSVHNAEMFIAEYSYSSYRDYAKIGLPRPTKKILTPKEFPAYFRSATDFKNMHREWLNFESSKKDNTKV